MSVQSRSTKHSGAAVRRGRLSAEERRRQILERAVSTFAHHGYERASIAHVCAAAGIARGTLYQYFDDKRSLFRAVLLEYAQRIAAYMQPATPTEFGTQIDLNAIEKFLTGRFERIYALVHAEREVYTILLKEALAKNAETEDLVEEMRRAFVALMVGEMRIAQGLGLIAVDDPEFAAGFVLGGIFHTALVGILSAKRPTAPRLLAEKTTQLVLGTLGVPPHAQRAKTSRR